LFACALSGPSLHARHVRFVYQVQDMLKYNSISHNDTLCAIRC